MNQDYNYQEPTYKDVESASVILNGVSNKTPVMTSRKLNSMIIPSGQIQVFLKCENFQRMGAFKFRGAYNSLSNLSVEQKKCGVLTFSSGNHAQAIALSGQILGIKTTIIMPQDAPPLKIEATKEYGGEVILYDRYKEDREAIASKIQKEKNLILIHPFDYPLVIAGQGTVAKELFEEVGELDYLFVCVGGGGLISGTCLSARNLSKNCKVIGVEPEAGNDCQQSFIKGEIVKIATPNTIADGAQTPNIGVLNFKIIQKYVHDIITVSDRELIDNMIFMYERMKIIVEPTGCLGIAGLRKYARDNIIQEKSKIGVIISGGNIDLQRFCKLVSKDLD